MNVDYIEKVLLNNGVLEYKLLSIGAYTHCGHNYIQVHCDRKDIEFSELFNINDIKHACHKYVWLYHKYKFSENQYGNVVPPDKERMLNVSNNRNDRAV
jgi:hypothetical protein